MTSGCLEYGGAKQGFLVAEACLLGAAERRMFTGTMYTAKDNLNINSCLVWQSYQIVVLK